MLLLFIIYALSDFSLVSLGFMFKIGFVPDLTIFKYLWKSVMFFSHILLLAVSCMLS